MTEPIPDTKAPRTRWMWVGIIALLAVAAVIMFINPDGDESLETIPDHAVTTQEERINQQIDINEPGEADTEELLNGTDGEVDAIVITEDEDAVTETPAPAE